MRVLALSVLLIASASAAQEADSLGTLAGTVTDAETGEPLPGATVVLAGTQPGVATDLEGRYEITGIRPGRYTVRFSFIGFVTQEAEAVSIHAGTKRTLDAELVVGEIISCPVVCSSRPVISRSPYASTRIERSGDGWCAEDTAVRSLAFGPPR